MKLFALLAVTAALLLAPLGARLASPPPANAHIYYCGHSIKYNSNGTIAERYQGGWGNHFHGYATYKQYPNGSWHFLDGHTRACAAH